MKTTLKLHLLLGLLLAALFCSSAKATILWDGDANKGTSVFGSLNIENNPGIIEVVTDGTFGKVFHMVCFDNGNTKVRTEGSRMRNFQPLAGNNYYFGWRHKWGPLPTKCGKWQVLEQIHLSGTGAAGGPVPFGLHVDGCDSNMEFEYQDGGGTAQNFLVMPFPPLNSWHSFVYYMRWSESESDGFVEFWYDGTKRTLANGQQRYPSAWCFPNATSYWKWGIYRSGSGGPIGTSHAYLWRPRCATTFAEVDPLGGAQAAAPTFSPPAGTYTSGQSVTISSTTAGASIRYTTDGSTPTSTSGTLYTGPVAINVTTTLKAVAYATGFSDSPVTTGVYTINLPQAAAPTFSPPAGNYPDAQSVAISTTTGGASIRYTTDGSTPSATAGTLYTGPVAIGATTTLKAIAFASGFANSAVTTGVYTIGTVSTLAFEANAVAHTESGATAALQNDANMTGGTWLALLADGAGDWIQFTLPGVPAGTYQVKLTYKRHPNRGILQASVNGSNLGGTLDQYSATTSYPEHTFGTVTFGASGNQTLRLTCTGRNPSAGAFTLSADVITLVPTTSPPPTVAFESESLARTSSGASMTTNNDAGASGGVWIGLTSTAAGPSMTHTTPSMAAGTYQLRFTYKFNNNRGQHAVRVDGVQVGGTIDQYNSTAGFTTVTLGNVTFGSAGTHTIQLTVTGKQAASGNFNVSADKFTFVGQ